jgi:hypothetical protein
MGDRYFCESKVDCRLPGSIEIIQEPRPVVVRGLAEIMAVETFNIRRQSPFEISYRNAILALEWNCKRSKEGKYDRLSNNLEQC